MPLRLSVSSRRSLLTLCVIARNEAGRLAACLESMRGVADECLVLDTGSTDETVAIARGAGARVEHFTWCDDFAAARNAVIEHATGGWVLMLDADERLAPGAGAPLRALLDQTAVDAWILPILHWLDPEGQRVLTQGTLKLFRRKPEFRYRGRIHEDIHGPIQEAGGRVAMATPAVIHLGHAEGPERTAERMARNLALLERQVAEEPDNAFAWFNLGDTLRLLGRRREAIAPLTRARELVRGGPEAAYHAVLWFSLGEALRESGRAEEGRAVLAEGSERWPRDANLQYSMALACLDTGDVPGAIARLEHCLTLKGEPSVTPVDPATTGHKALQTMAAAWLRLGDMGRAYEAYARAMACHPAPNEDEWRTLGQLKEAACA